MKYEILHLFNNQSHNLKLPNKGNSRPRWKFLQILNVNITPVRTKYFWRMDYYESNKTLILDTDKNHMIKINFKLISSKILDLKVLNKKLSKSNQVVHKKDATLQLGQVHFRNVKMI